MPLRQLKSLYEKRRQTLQEASNSRKLGHERKEQVIGALGEIDSFIKTIDTLREQEITDNQKINARLSLDLGHSIFKGINEKFQSRFDKSETRKNLVLLFLKKCETNMRYDFYSKLAKKEGYEVIAHTFAEFSSQEKEHAQLIFKYLHWDRKTKENLLESADIERQCHTKLYDEFEDTAFKEKFKEIGEFIRELSDIEAEHEKQFIKVLKILQDNKIFLSDIISKWKCRNCGYVTETKMAPKKCKVCKKDQAFFEVWKE
jgi:rubrerythrin